MRVNGKLFVCVVVLLLLAQGLVAQQDRKPESDDVLRISTELVQTGVSVFDKQGRFVEGLTKEDFELQVDRRPVPISFFESIVAGSARDRSARRLTQNNPLPEDRTATTSVRRRTIVFFIDDRHLSLDGLGRTRRTLLSFIDKQMGQNDLVAIASASGHIGFLQQFTDNKEVLRAAVARISHVPNSVTDYGKNPGSPMTEYMALTIEQKDDRNVFEFYVQDCLKWALKPPGARRNARAQCEIEVTNRARQILLQAGAVTSSSYYSLETLLQSVEKMPGSKLAFFISDGFLADTGPRSQVGRDRLGRITDKARRAGMVIYTIDARGLISGALDATGNVPFDSGGMLENANLREIAATQDALHSLAVDTGGRALRNQNEFDQFINVALDETSRYYLIAWRPEAGDEKDDKLRKITVSVIGRPDLTVRSARGFTNRRTVASATDERKSEAESGKNTRAKQPDADIQEALKDFYPKQAFPLQLALIYLDTPASGSVLTTSVQASAESLSYGEEGKDPARVTIAGVVLNDQGKPAASFRTGLKVNRASAATSQGTASNVIYNYPAPLKSGIYQVRVAARDDASGLVGSAMQWIVIPDLASRQLSMSSLLVGLESVAANSASAERIQWSVDRKFGRGSHLRFITFVYNAAQASPRVTNLAARVQVYRDSRPVLSLPTAKLSVPTDTDPARVPFASEIDLTRLPPGAYVLEVTIEDLVAHKSVSQQTTFYVE
ncbi:MAG TPA: VWA domain-containing protein [Pyrinomonadaceae bacterium]|nr:VWA domain-containing protein [Pyrinomonadaceae bacterium]